MNRKELAGCAFLATSFFLLGWIANSQQSPPAEEIPPSQSELWQPASLRPECRKMLDDIHKNTTTRANCRAVVGRIVDAPNGACRGYGAEGLQNVICKEKPLAVSDSQPSESDKGNIQSPSLPAPTNVGISPPTPAIFQASQAAPTMYPSWLSPYCVDALRELKFDGLSKKECLQSLNEVSEKSAGGCRYDFVMQFASEICSNANQTENPKPPADKTE